MAQAQLLHAVRIVPMRKLLLSAAALATLGTGAAVLGQTVEGLNLDAIRARSETMAADAQALSTEVQRRGDAFRKDAETVHAVAIVAHRPGAHPRRRRIGCSNQVYDAIVRTNEMATTTMSRSKPAAKGKRGARSTMTGQCHR